MCASPDAHDFIWDLKKEKDACTPEPRCSILVTCVIRVSDSICPPYFTPKEEVSREIDQRIGR